MHIRCVSHSIFNSGQHFTLFFSSYSSHAAVVPTRLLIALPPAPALGTYTRWRWSILFWYTGCSVGSKQLMLKSRLAQNEGLSRSTYACSCVCDWGLAYLTLPPTLLWPAHIYPPRIYVHVHVHAGQRAHLSHLPHMYLYICANDVQLQRLQSTQSVAHSPQLWVLQVHGVLVATEWLPEAGLVHSSQQPLTHHTWAGITAGPSPSSSSPPPIPFILHPPSSTLYHSSWICPSRWG